MLFFFLNVVFFKMCSISQNRTHLSKVTLFAIDPHLILYYFLFVLPPRGDKLSTAVVEAPICYYSCINVLFIYEMDFCEKCHHQTKFSLGLFIKNIQLSLHCTIAVQMLLKKKKKGAEDVELETTTFHHKRQQKSKFWGKKFTFLSHFLHVCVSFHVRVCMKLISKRLYICSVLH